MFKTFFTITLRSLSRQGVFSIINILGLSIGLVVVLLISLLNFNELSFDKGFKEGKNIYRINTVTEAETYMSSSNAVGPAMKAEIPEVVTAVRTFRRDYDMRINDNTVGIQVIWADEDFFRLFDTPFLLGSTEDVLSRPNTIVISESEAKRLFGNDNPIGKTIAHTFWNAPPLEVIAVYKDYPINSSLRNYKAIAPFMHCQEALVHRQITWMRGEFETFCLLTPNADPEVVNEKLLKIVSDATKDQQSTYTTQLQRFTEIYLYSKKFTDLFRIAFRESGDIERVKMLTLLSLIILLVACINYMNLSTARVQKRSREIGISKTVGASRFELIMRLTFETGVFTFASFIIAFLLSWAFLPVFNNLMGTNLTFGMALQPLFLCLALLIWIVTTLLAASYPALYMSGFPPLTAIRNQSMPGSSHAIVRKVLNIGQFAIATVLISWSLIIQTQMEFVNKKDLGYNPKNIVSFWIHDSNPSALLEEFKALSTVEMISRENEIGNFFGISENLLYRDHEDKIGLPLNINVAEPNYIELMQMKLLAGSTYPEMRIDQLNFRDTIVENKTYRMLAENNSFQIILNRAAVEYLGKTPEEVIGQKVIGQFSGAIGYPVVCGVIENYHYESLYRPVGGVCLHFGLTQHKRHLLLRVTEGNLQEQFRTYEEIYKKFFPNNIFTPVLLEEQVAHFYDGERRTVQLAVLFSILAIFVACMGVFGLTAFMAEQRTKEIGIRKVMGANLWKIVLLFTIDYVKLLCISLVIAIPIAWWVGIQYLQSFAYRISLSWWIFALAALITIALTLLTVGLQAIKAASKNPVDAVKTD